VSFCGAAASQNFSHAAKTREGVNGLKVAQGETVDTAFGIKADVVELANLVAF
jgi:hypothetical protein